MLAILPQEPLELRDTAVDELRRQRRLRRPSPLRVEDPGEPSRIPEAFGIRGDPGSTLRAASLASVRVREAIVRRNHDLDRADAREVDRRPLSESPRIAAVRIDWLRSRDPGLKLARLGLDGFELSGWATGLARGPALTVALEGAMFSVSLDPHDSAAASMGALIRRLEAAYLCEIVEEGRERTSARVTRPRFSRRLS